MTIQQVFDALLGPVGLLVGLILIVWAGYKKIWVFGWYAKELIERNNRLETRLDTASKRLDAATELADKATKIAEKHTEVTNG